MEEEEREEEGGACGGNWVGEGVGERVGVGVGKGEGKGDEEGEAEAGVEDEGGSGSDPAVWATPVAGLLAAGDSGTACGPWLWLPLCVFWVVFWDFLGLLGLAVPRDLSEYLPSIYPRSC